ncbi:MAG: ABC transporter permease [Bacillota bacterium]
MSFWRFVARRLVLMLVVLAGVSVITFALTHIVPADPVAAALGDRATEEQIAKVREQLGLNKPLYVQFGIYVKGLLQGNLGESIRNRRPVIEDLVTYLPATLELSTGAILVAILVGVPTGVISAVYKDRFQDQFTRIFSLIGVSVPVFYLALVLLGLLYTKLGWVPGSGRLDTYTVPPAEVTGLILVDSILEGNWHALSDGLWHLLLPSFVLGFHSAGVITRMTRSSMLEVLTQDYVRTARAKGLNERTVIFRHALRNAMIPTVTVIGLAYGSLLAGAVLTETIFSWPGIGRYATDSVVNLDIPAIMGVTLVAAVIYSFANLVVDLTYGALDPRIRYD